MYFQVPNKQKKMIKYLTNFKECLMYEENEETKIHSGKKYSPCSEDYFNKILRILKTRFLYRMQIRKVNLICLF
jgi:hypothetical protein